MEASGVGTGTWVGNAQVHFGIGLQGPAVGATAIADHLAVLGQIPVSIDPPSKGSMPQAGHRLGGRTGGQEVQGARLEPRPLTVATT